MADITHIIEEASEVFDKLCQTRHETGQKEYGEFTFMGNDVVRMMLEELADTANYCRYQAIKLLILQEMLENKLSEAGHEDEITIGIKSFKGAGAGWDV